MLESHPKSCKGGATMRLFIRACSSTPRTALLLLRSFRSKVACLAAFSTFQSTSTVSRRLITYMQCRRPMRLDRHASRSPVYLIRRIHLQPSFDLSPPPRDGTNVEPPMTPKGGAIAIHTMCMHPSNLVDEPVECPTCPRWTNPKLYHTRTVSRIDGGSTWWTPVQRHDATNKRWSARAIRGARLLVGYMFRRNQAIGRHPLGTHRGHLALSKCKHESRTRSGWDPSHQTGKHYGDQYAEY